MAKVHYELKITETSGHVLTPSYNTDIDSDPGQKWVEDFFGCREPDVVNFSITRNVID